MGWAAGSYDAQRASRQAFCGVDNLSMQTALASGGRTAVRLVRPARLALAVGYGLNDWLNAVAAAGGAACLTHLLAANPLRISVGPPAAKVIAIRIENPSGEPLDGAARLTEIRGLRVDKPSAKLQFCSGETENHPPESIKCQMWGCDPDDP
jgi:hypothetical protein